MYVWGLPTCSRTSAVGKSVYLSLVYRYVKRIKHVILLFP